MCRVVARIPQKLKSTVFKFFLPSSSSTKKKFKKRWFYLLRVSTKIFPKLHFFRISAHCGINTKHTFSTDGNQFDSFAGNEVQSLVDIGDLVEPHLATIRLLECFSGNDLEQQHQFEAIAEVLFNVFNLRPSFA